jgi:GDP-L-fucose synthase
MFFSKDFCNVLNSARLFECVAKAKPEAIIHMAAKCGGIGANRESPASFWHENLMMGMNVLAVAYGLGIQKVVSIGTTCSYPKHCSVPFKEDDLFKGYPEDTNAPYGIAKAALLVGARAYHEQYGMNALTLIPTNLYGPGDHFEPDRSHVIPALIRKFAKNKNSVVLWGSGKPTRDFVYVDDAAQAIVAALETYDSDCPINLGSGVEVSIMDLAWMSADLMDWKGTLTFDKTKPDGQPRRCLDTSRASKYLGWKATTPLAKGLKKTIDWYLTHKTKEI